MNMHTLNNITSSSTILPAQPTDQVNNPPTKSSDCNIKNVSKSKLKSESLGSLLRSPNKLKELGTVQTLKKSNNTGQIDDKNGEDTKDDENSKSSLGKTGKSDMLQKDELTEGLVSKKLTKFKSFYQKTYLCKYCCRRFFSEGQLQQHSKSHGNKNSYICYLCNHQTGSFSSLMTHYLKHSGTKGSNKLEKIYAKSKADFTNIQFNVSSRPKPSSVQCPKCNQLFISKAKLRSHICSAAIMEKKSYNCAYCGHVSYTVEDYRNCIQSHSETPFVCSYCTRKFQRKKLLDKHLEQCAEYRCEKCAAFSCNSKKDLDKHLKGCIKIDSQSYICVNCDSTFSEETVYDDHVVICEPHENVELVVKKRGRRPKNVQKKSAKFICSACGDTFRSKTELKQHEKSCITEENDDEDDMYDDIASIYSNKGTLTNVNKCSEPVEACSLVNKAKFKKKDAYVSAVTTFASQNETPVQKKRKISFKNNTYSDKNSSCDEDMSLLSKKIPSNADETYSLKKLINIKDKTTARRSTRLVRRKSSLSDDEEVITKKRILKIRFQKKPRISVKPKFRRGKSAKNSNATFLCNVCDFTFCSKSTLERHKRMHSGNPWYTCGFCGKFFFRKDVYIRHESNVHNNSSKAVFCCCYCKLDFANSTALRDHVLDTHKDSAFLPIRPRFPKCSSSTVEVKQEAKSVNELSNLIEPAVDESITFPIKSLDISHYTEDTKTDLDKGHDVICKTNKKIKNVKLCKKKYPKKKGLKLSSNENDPSAMLENTEACLDKLNNPKSDLLNVPGSSYISSENSNALRCVLCFKQFSDKSTFEAHSKTMHKIVDWYQCLVCSESGPKQAMLEHMFTHMFKVGTFVVNSNSRNFDAIVPCLQLENCTKITDKTAGEVNGSRANQMSSEMMDLISSEELPPLREFGVCLCVDSKLKQGIHEMPDLEKEAELLIENNPTHSEEVAENISAYNTATDEDHSSGESEMDLGDCLKNTKSTLGTEVAPIDTMTTEENKMVVAHDMNTIAHNKTVAHDIDVKKSHETSAVKNKDLSLSYSSDAMTSSDHICTKTNFSVKADDVYKEGNRADIMDLKMSDNIKINKSKSHKMLHENKICKEENLCISPGEEKAGFTHTKGSEVTEENLNASTNISRVKKNTKKRRSKSDNTPQKEITKKDLNVCTGKKGNKKLKEGKMAEVLNIGNVTSPVKSNAGEKGIKSQNVLQEEKMSNEGQNICSFKSPGKGNIDRKDVTSHNLLEKKTMPKKYLKALSNTNVVKINVERQPTKSENFSEENRMLKEESKMCNVTSTIKSNSEKVDVESHNLVQDKKMTKKEVNVLSINSPVKGNSGKKGTKLPNLVQKEKNSQGALNLSSVNSNVEKKCGKSINVSQKEKTSKELKVSSINSSGSNNARKKCVRIPNILRQKKAKITSTTPVKTSDPRTFIEPINVFEKEKMVQSSIKTNDTIAVNESNNLLQEKEKEKIDLCSITSSININDAKIDIKSYNLLQKEEKKDIAISTSPIETNDSIIKNESCSLLEEERRVKIDPGIVTSPIKINDPKINVKFYNLLQDEKVDTSDLASPIKTSDPRTSFESYTLLPEDGKIKEKTNNLSCITIPIKRNDRKIRVQSKDLLEKKTKIDLSDISRPVKNCVETKNAKVKNLFLEESVVKELNLFDTSPVKISPEIKFDDSSSLERKTAVEPNVSTISSPLKSNFERTTTLEPNVSTISIPAGTNFERKTLEHNLFTISSPVKSNFEQTTLEHNVSTISSPVKRPTTLKPNVSTISSPVKSNFKRKTLEHNVFTISSTIKSNFEQATTLEPNLCTVSSPVKSNLERKARLEQSVSTISSSFKRKATLDQTGSTISSPIKDNFGRKRTLEQNMSIVSSSVASDFERKSESSATSQILHDKKEKELNLYGVTSSVLTSPLKPGRTKSQNLSMEETTKELNLTSIPSFVNSSVITSFKPLKLFQMEEKSNAPSYSEWISGLNSGSTSLDAYIKAPSTLNKQEIKNEIGLPVTNIAPVSMNIKTFNTLNEKEAKELNLSNVTFSSQDNECLNFQTEKSAFESQSNFQETESFSQLRYLLQKPSKLLAENNENKITIYPASQDTEESGREGSNPFVAYVNTSENQNLVEAVSFPETKFTFEMPKQTSNIFNNDINYSVQASSDITQSNTCLKFDINQSRSEVSGGNLIMSPLNSMSQNYVQDKSAENLFKACPPQSTILDFSDLIQHSFENISPSEDNIFSYPTTTPAKEVNFLSGATSREEVCTPDCTDIVNYESGLLNSTVKCKDCDLSFNNNYDLIRHTCIPTKNQIFEGIDLSFKPKIPSQPLNFVTNQNKVPCITSTSPQKFSVLVSPKSAETIMCSSSSMSPQVQTVLENQNKVSCITNTSEQRLNAQSHSKYTNEAFIVPLVMEQERFHRPVLLQNLSQSGSKCNKCQKTFRDIGELMKHSLTCLKSLFFKTAQTNNFAAPVAQSEALQTLLLRDLPNTTFSNMPSLSPSKESSYKTSDDLKHLFDS